MNYLEPVIYILAGTVAGLLGQFVIGPVLKKVLAKSGNIVLKSAVARCFAPVLWLLILVIGRLGVAVAAIPEKTADFAKHLISLLLIAVVSWLIIKCMYVLEDYVTGRFDVNVKDNLSARKIHTQLSVIKRIIVIAVCIVAFATMLMTFERVRQLGTTILASAGIVGIVVGMAAQKTIGTFIAGIQIAIAQPIRIDDVVIVENEWGRIEEITLTYVVVRIWDLRRLIVPITYFIEKPFQNWTRVSADLLGTVFLYTDYTVPLDKIRGQLEKILSETDMWDKKVCVVQVTNATERTVEVRALMSAADASTLWSLRCLVREKLIDFIQKSYPQALPKTRAELNQPETDKQNPRK